MAAVLVTGGARSGKSRFAEQYAATLGTEGIYVATSQTLDEEMRDRVGRHRARREGMSFVWNTVEEPYELARVLEAGRGSIVLIDCLTIWLSNWLLRCEQEADAEAAVQAQVEALVSAFERLSEDDAVIAVTNEVGSGVVPAYPLGRQFRDLAGWMNQRLASVCQQVFLVTAGIPVELKRLAYTLPGGEGAPR